MTWCRDIVGPVDRIGGTRFPDVPEIGARGRSDHPGASRAAELDDSPASENGGAGDQSGRAILQSTGID